VLEDILWTVSSVILCHPVPWHPGFVVHYCQYQVHAGQFCCHSGIGMMTSADQFTDLSGLCALKFGPGFRPLAFKGLTQWYKIDFTITVLYLVIRWHHYCKMPYLFESYLSVVLFCTEYFLCLTYSVLNEWQLFVVWQISAETPACMSPISLQHCSHLHWSQSLLTIAGMSGVAGVISSHLEMNCSHESLRFQGHQISWVSEWLSTHFFQ